MSFFLTQFERLNWTFGKQIKQTADVIIEIEHDEITDDNCGEFNDAAWSALREQVGWNNDTKLPLDAGWSSALGGRKFEKLDVPHMNREIEQSTKNKLVIAGRFSTKSSKHIFRATSFYKLEWHVPKPTTAVIVKAKKLMPELFNGRWRHVPCLPEEAQIVSGCGICGCMELISEVTIEEGLVGWSDVALKQEQGEWADRVANVDEEQLIDINIQCGKLNAEFAEKLGLRPPVDTDDQGDIK